MPRTPFGGSLGVIIDTSNLPPLPAVTGAVDHTSGIGGWGMMANDRLADCVLAAFGHAIELWTAKSRGRPVVLPDSTIVQAYRDIAHYDPATGANDDGMTVSDGLEYWRVHGLGGHRLHSFLRISPGFDLNNIRRAIDVFGVCIIVIGMNKNISGAYNRADPWFGSFGPADDDDLHCVPLVAYDQDALQCVTWGTLQRLNWAFYNTYVTEAYVPVGADWFNSRGLSISGGYTPDQLQRLAWRIVLASTVV